MITSVTIDGKAYPCRESMGAMLRFKEETGREVTEIKQNELSELGKYIYYCVKSACAKDKVGFDMPLLDFLDSVTAEDLSAWNDAKVAEAQQEEQRRKAKAEKKNSV